MVKTKVKIYTIIFVALFIIFAFSCSNLAIKQRFEFEEFGSYEFPKDWKIVKTKMDNDELLYEISKDGVIFGYAGTPTKCDISYCFSISSSVNIQLLERTYNGRGYTNSIDVTALEIDADIDGVIYILRSLYLRNNLTIVFFEEKVSWSQLVEIADSYKR